jgi:hypothetical protein
MSNPLAVLMDVRSIGMAPTVAIRRPGRSLTRAVATVRGRPVLGHETTANPLASGGALTASSVFSVLRPDGECESEKQKEDSGGEEHSMYLQPFRIGVGMSR